MLTVIMMIPKTAIKTYTRNAEPENINDLMLPTSQFLAYGSTAIAVITNSTIISSKLLLLEQLLGDHYVFNRISRIYYSTSCRY